MLGCFLRLQFEPYIHNGCLPFTLANRSVHGLGKRFVPELRLPLFCTNQFQLPKNGREGLKLVSKMAVKKWNTNFRLSVRKNRTTFQMFRCSRTFSAGTTQKVVFHLLSKRMSLKLFVNFKQPT